MMIAVMDKRELEIIEFIKHKIAKLKIHSDKMVVGAAKDSYREAIAELSCLGMDIQAYKHRN